MTRTIRGIVQVLFFAVFIVTMVTGKAQIWMGFIFLSILAAAFLGRLYCGWACPINTTMWPFIWISKKLGLQKKYVPEVLRSGKIRIAVFTLFLAGLGYTIYTISQGRKFPLPLIIIPLGVITAFFINEKSWHRYLCPWGILFSFTARLSKRGIKVENSCLSCSACEKVCPGDAIVVEKCSGAAIDQTYCLVCLDCTLKCPSKFLSYKKEQKEVVLK